MRIDMHRLQELVRLHRRGTAVHEVARLIGMSPNTERRYREALAEAGLLDGDEHDLPELEALKQAVLSRLPAKPLPQQASTVEPWSEEVAKMSARGAMPKAIFDALRLDDPEFDGSLDAVKRLWRRLRRAAGPDPTEVAIPVDTGPGEVAQVDFGYVGPLYDRHSGKMRRAWVFVMVLAFSRHMFAKIVFDQRASTWQQLHVEAFAELGGVPAAIVPDNLKAAVVRAAFGADRDDLALNRSYRELARHYGFQIDPAPPRAPKKKGKVESGVKYVRRNFLTPRALEDYEEAQAELRRWRLEIAGTRVHGTTKRQPLEVFESEERSALQPLPARPFVPVEWKVAKVHPNSHIVFDKREYSVPWVHVGKDVWVRATPESVAIYVEDERVQTHDRRATGLRSTIESDLPEHRRDLRHRSRGYWMSRARLMGDEVAEYIEEVFGSDDVLSQLRTVQAIVTHLEQFPRERARAACERARFYGNHSYKGVKDILRKGLDLEPPAPKLFEEPAKPPRPRFSRVPLQEVSHESH